MTFAAGTGVAHAAPAKFKNCAELQKKYEYGVALDKGSAQNADMQTPAVNRNLYLANRKLDRDRDGVACEVLLTASPATEPTPTATPAPTPTATSNVYWITTNVILLDAYMKTLINQNKINQPQSNFMWAVASTFQKNPTATCLYFKTDAGRAALLAGLVSSANMSKVGLDDSYLPWASELTPLVISMTCAAYA
jgi:hypothetical protein